MEIYIHPKDTCEIYFLSQKNNSRYEQNLRQYIPRRPPGIRHGLAASLMHRDASEVSVMPSTALSLHGRCIGKAHRDASEVSVMPSTALSLHGRCIGKARREASGVSVRPSTALSLKEIQ